MPGKIDFLILSSQNIGKIGALQVMLKAAPGEIIAYCDDDVFFLPGWLERHLEVIDTYPNVGAVTGMYIKPHMKEGISSTLKFAESRWRQSGTWNAWLKKNLNSIILTKPAEPGKNIRKK